MLSRVLSLTALCAVVALGAWVPGLAQAAEASHVAPINSHPYGKTYQQWSARWWQWFFSVPASKNPGLVGDGAVDCHAGQSGRVWFLAGRFLAGGSLSRSCEIPQGKALFIPVINAWADNVCNAPAWTVAQLRASADAGVLPATSLHASIDGKAISDLSSFRAVSPVFSYRLPPSPDNVIAAAFGVTLPGTCWPTLTVTPAVADGFYIMLSPLGPGRHTLKFGGSPPGMTLDVTYHLLVTERELEGSSVD